MSSKKPSPLLNLEESYVASATDIEALRRKPSRARMSAAEYLEFLAQFEISSETLRARRGPRGEPFTL